MKFAEIRSYLPVAFFMAFFAMGGCAVTKPAMPPLASVEGVPGHFRMGRIIRLDTGKALSFDRFIDQLESKDLIFIGEKHDNPEHHLIQVQILQALMSRYGDLSVAMEFFQEPQQPVLDRYMEGHGPLITIFTGLSYLCSGKRGAESMPSMRRMIL